MTTISPIGLARQITEAYRANETTTASAAGGTDFASMLSHAASTAVQTMRQAEQVTASGLAGKADTQSVVQALSNAEVTMQTVVAVRDKVLSAYNDIIHMNI
jgi:flagellar hook-basal body complex protein FliE